MRTRAEPGDLELAVLIQRKAGNQVTSLRVEGRDMGSEHTRAGACYPSARHARVLPKTPIGIEVGHTGDIVRLQLAIDGAGSKRNRKHYRTRACHPPVS